MYAIEDPSFDGSREMNLINKILDAIENRDKDIFTAAINEYNNITPFNKVKTSLMVQIKELYIPEDQPPMVAKKAELDFTGAQEEAEDGGGSGHPAAMGGGDIDFR